MAEVLIGVAGLGKKYRISHRRAERYTALRDVISEKGRALLKGLTRSGERAPEADEDFWALRDVSFEARRGEVLGIVGRNGAGKSTLLKLLSRITDPTEGRAVLDGRVASLLEVGTGFHPELSGRENIFLNGAILGMTRAEIRRKLDDIIAFAEVERFVDTPVKRYSSGMYVRLAFAVAAHLEPDILIVDEVLAVGDSRFQRKCLGKIEEVGNAGRTVLIVSHNMSTITTLCQRALWLSNGRVVMDDTAERVTAGYLQEGAACSGDVVLSRDGQSTRFAFERITFTDPQGSPASVFDIREPIGVRLQYSVLNAVPDLEVGLRVYNASGIPIFTTNRSQSTRQPLAPGTYVSTLVIPATFLSAGMYTVAVGAHVPHVEVLTYLTSTAAFTVEETGSSMAGYGADHGVVLLELPWNESRL